MIDNWESLREKQAQEPYWAELQQFVTDERSRGEVYPPEDQVFRAFDLTPLDEVKVVIVGQDPYHGAGQAHGLAFSVQHGVGAPPSLKNIYKELQSDLGCQPPSHGSLEHWATHGVLLLNVVLTVRQGKARSHGGRGWELFTTEVLRTLGSRPEPTVFMLWGGEARKKKRLIAAHHCVIESSHPSPNWRSAEKGFFGSRPFSRANEFLTANGRESVDWCIPDA